MTGPEDFDEIARDMKPADVSGRRPGGMLKWMVVGIVVLFAMVFIWAKFFTSSTDQISKTRAEGPAKKAEAMRDPGVKTDSAAYADAVNKASDRKADEAQKTGGDALPRLVAMAPAQEAPAPPIPAPAVAKPAAPAPVAVSAPRQAQAPAGYGNDKAVDVTKWLLPLSPAPGKVVETKEAAAKAKAPSKDEPVAASRDEARSRPVRPGLEPGTVLYAVVDIGVNSDQEGTPVVAHVLSGPFEGATVMGGFKRSSERLVVQFNKIVAKGVQAEFSGYAVDPKTQSPGVASSVDTHFLERWGGLVASSFISGLGSAVATGGTSIIYGGTTAPTVSTTNHTLSDQMLMAAGKVGDKASQQFANNFNIPPTVTLDPGQPIGILVL
jgi:type IV secretory pathway VirB10-like protein